MKIMELSATVEMMNSPDFRERFKAEYHQLLNRIEGLWRILQKYKDGSLPFAPKCSYGLLYTQYIHMKNYLDTLELRASAEGINLFETENDGKCVRLED